MTAFSRTCVVVAALAVAFGQAGCGDSEGDAAERSGSAAPPTRAEQLRTAREVRADETGRIPVLEYHRVGGDPDFAPEWTISTKEFRAELEFLREHDFHPINLRDFVANEIDVPAGRTPVVLTFDDSSDTQFTLIKDADGEWVPDPKGAVGSLADFHRRHADWPQRATWFVLPAADPPNDFFGQRALIKRKLEYLVGQGMEIGGHSLYHADLSSSTPEQIREQLARSVIEIQRHLPGYELKTMSVPFGQYPADESLLRRGEWEGQKYEFEAVVEVSGGPALPPGALGFDPMHIPRVQTGPNPGQSREVLRRLVRRSSGRYVSDGDPDTISFSKRHAERLDLAGLHADGKVFRGY